MKKHLKDYFIPHEGNTYKPHSLQKAAVVGMVGMILLSFTIANIQSLVWISSQWMVSTILPAVIVDLTNEERSVSSLGVLRRNAILDEAARLKAQDMAQHQYFAHYSPTGVTPWHWFSEVSYNFVHAGENLAIHFTDSGDVVDAWMDSPTHRENIMNGNYTEIGVGTAEGTYEGFKTVYVVQVFGTPAIASETSVNEFAQTEEVQAAKIVVSEEDAFPESEETSVLAESVAITEEVQIFEAEPVVVEVESGDVKKNNDVSEVVATTSETQVVDMEVTDTGVALYSDFIATSTGAIPATIDTQITHDTVSTVPYIVRLATQPHAVLQILYSTIALFVSFVLVLSIVIEIRRQEPMQIAYGVALLFLMYGLFEIHTYVSSGVLIV